MKTTGLAAGFLSALAFAGAARAQSAAPTTVAPMPLTPQVSLTPSLDAAYTADAGAPVGKAAGTVMVRARIIGVIPEDNSSSVSLIGGKVNVTATPAPEVDLSYFFTDNIAAELIAASTRHVVSATGTVLGKVDVGSTYVLPPTLSAQYHFFPHSQFSPYVGLGLTVAWFYDSGPSGGAVTKFGLSTAVGPSFEAGFDYNITGHWFANFDVKQILLRTTTHIDGGVLKAKTWLDPLVVGAGIGYRF